MADTKLSALTALAVEMADADNIYLNDGGVSKKQTYAVFKAAFATAAQGDLADSSVQPGDLGTAAAEDVGYFADAAQGILADSAIQPADIGTAAAEDVGFFATAAQGALADSASQEDWTDSAENFKTTGTGNIGGAMTTNNNVLTTQNKFFTGANSLTEPKLQFDAEDNLQFERTTNTYGFKIGNILQLELDATEADFQDNAITTTGIISGVGTGITELAGGRDFALSDEGSDLTTGTKITWYPPYAVTLTGVYTSVTGAPTDATLIVDIHASGTTLMDTDKIEIETGELHSSDATTQPTLTDTSLAQFEKVEIIVDQIGSTAAGTGLKCYLLWTRDA
jgi:hypothetical protein